MDDDKADSNYDQDSEADNGDSEDDNEDSDGNPNYDGYFPHEDNSHSDGYRSDTGPDDDDVGSVRGNLEEKDDWVRALGA